jgi:nucleotide-binding universal stress UspA family protein
MPAIRLAQTAAALQKVRRTDTFSPICVEVSQCRARGAPMWEDAPATEGLMSFRKILIALDGSAVAARAADVALDLARSLHGEVALVHAVEPIADYAAEGGIPTAVLLSETEEDGRRMLAGYRQRTSSAPPPLELLRLGKPGQEIVKAASEWPADLVVIGSHGRTGLSRLVMGSVAEHVMRHAPCPVLVVRAQE